MTETTTVESRVEALLQRNPALQTTLESMDPDQREGWLRHAAELIRERRAQRAAERPVTDGDSTAETAELDDLPDDDEEILELLNAVVAATAAGFEIDPAEWDDEGTEDADDEDSTVMVGDVEIDLDAVLSGEVEPTEAQLAALQNAEIEWEID